MFTNKILIILATLTCSGCAKVFEFHNSGTQELWIGTQGNAGHSPLKNGGWKMAPKETISVEATDNWSGRFWARTWCNSETSHCETGDCGNRIECQGAGGGPPATLVQITLKGGDGNDYYSLSLVDGFNAKVSIKPHDGAKTGAKNSCKEISCTADINNECPKELSVTTENGIVACRSACNAFNDDQYCCRGAHNLPKTCTVKDWPTNYPKFFKDKCPDAYSYAYDDSSSVFTCRAEKYIVTFSH